MTDAATRAPIAGAEVCVDGWSSDLPDELLRDPSCAITDASGRYRVPELMPASYVVHASARTYRPEAARPADDPRSRVVVLAAAEHRAGVDIELSPGAVQITGTVADLTGGPIAHARVRSGNRLTLRGGTTATTDEQGRFSLWVAPGSMSVTATADGYAPQTEIGSAPGTFEILLAPEGTFAGTVVDGRTGQPVAGARVTLSAADASAFLPGTTTFSDRDGAFQFSAVAPDRYTASATTADGHGRTEGSLQVGLGQRVDGVVLKLSPALRVEGKIVVAGGQPCRDGEVRLRDAQRRRDVNARETPGGVHIADGVVPGTYAVEASCHGFLSRPSYPPVVVADKDVTGLVWEVETGATLRGKITARSGAPIHGAWVTTRPATGEGFGDWRSASSGPDGSYEVLGLRPGKHRVEASVDRTPSLGEGTPIDIASATVERDFVLDDAGTIAGTVVDTAGAPVAGMSIVTQSADRMLPRLADCRSDSKGAFACSGLAAGDYRVVAQSGRFPRLPRPGQEDGEGEAVTVRAGQVSTVKLVVEARTGVIQGQVTDGEGHPVRDAFVSAAREEATPGPGGGPRGGMSILETRWSWGTRPNLTGTDGTFTISGLASGTYTLRAYRKGGGEAIAERVAVGSTATLQITAPGSIEGVARRAGAPVAALSVLVRNPTTWFSRQEQFHASDGRFIVRDVPSGKLQVVIETEGARKQVEIELGEGERKTGVDVELDELVTITGRIVERGTTAPVPGIRLFAQAEGGARRPMSRGDLDPPSDPQGRFTLRNVARGKVTILGFSSERTDRSYRPLRVERAIDGSGTVDLGDIEIERQPK